MTVSGCGCQPGQAAPALKCSASLQHRMQCQPCFHFWKDPELMTENYGAMLLTLGSMVALADYKGVMEKVTHFNMPMLYGPPMTGKTLAATCAAFIMGCTKQQIYSRYGNGRDMLDIKNNVNDLH